MANDCKIPCKLENFTMLIVITSWTCSNYCSNQIKTIGGLQAICFLFGFINAHNSSKLVLLNVIQRLAIKGNSGVSQEISSGCWCGFEALNDSVLMAASITIGTAHVPFRFLLADCGIHVGCRWQSRKDNPDQGLRGFN